MKVNNKKQARSQDFIKGGSNARVRRCVKILGVTMPS